MSTRTLIAGLLVSLVLALPASARDMVFGLSPHQTRQELQGQVEHVLTFAAAHLDAGETALIFDASRVRLIGSFVVPEGGGYDSMRARLQANTPLVGALRDFMQGAEPVPGRIGASDWSGLYRLLRSSYPADGDAALILLGSPIADAPTAPSVSMMGAKVPSDGHIAASAAQSPYGTTGLPGTLEGYDVFIGTIGEPWSISTQHAYHVERFWTLSAEAHGGDVGFFGDDLATLFRVAAREAGDQAHAQPLVATDKLEMLHFAPDTGRVSDLYALPPEEAPAPTPLWRAATGVVVGITWDQPGVDLDLYVRPNRTSEVIYFANAETSQGRLFKDFTTSPGAGFETVALNGTVDLSQIDLAINYYGSALASGGVSGELRIAIGDEVWAAPFGIAASRGNRGIGADQVLVDGILPNDAWGIVEPLAVLGVE